MYILGHILLQLHLEIQLLARSVPRLLPEPYFTNYLSLLSDNYSKLLVEYGWKRSATPDLWVW